MPVPKKSFLEKMQQGFLGLFGADDESIIEDARSQTSNEARGLDSGRLLALGRGELVEQRVGGLDPAALRTFDAMHYAQRREENAKALSREKWQDPSFTDRVVNTFDNTVDVAGGT